MKERSLNRRGTNGQSGANASSNGWAKQHGDKLGMVTDSQRLYHRLLNI